MSVLSVPRPLQERLGDAAASSLVEMLRQLEDDQEDRREVQKEHLFQLLEERFLRHVAESEQRTRQEIGEVREAVAGVRADLGNETANVRTDLGNEIANVRADLGNEIAGVRADLGNQIANVRADLGNQIASIHKEITVQTRWIVAVMAAAAVLIPIMQRVMEAILR